MNEVRELWGQPYSIDKFIALKDRPEDRSVEWEYSNEISFWVLDGIVDSFTIFPEYDDSGREVIWPKIKQRL